MGSSGWGERAWVNLLRIAPLRTYTRAVRVIAGVPVPRSLRRPLLGWAARRLGIDLSEAELPLEGYRSFTELFVRRLRSDARPIDGAKDSVVSPVDGCLVNRGVVEEGHLIQAKGIEYRLADLVGDVPLAARFEGGAYATIYLRPKDYHRIHSPVAGEVVSTRRLPGALFPVKPAVVRRRRGLFVGNERLVVELKVDSGSMLVVPVGASGVGTISTVFDAGEGYQRHAPGIPMGKGQELGAFNLGSTVILVFQRGAVELAALCEGQEIRMGTVVGRCRRSALRVA